MYLWYVKGKKKKIRPTTRHEVPEGGGVEV